MNNIEKDTLIRFGKVVKVEGNDNGKEGYGGLRIKVKLEPEDSAISNDDDLPWCFPALPKIIHINPKIGETVIVILENRKLIHGQRFFIGPVISQPYFMNESFDNTSARALLNGKQKSSPYPNPKNNVDNEGTLPERDDVAILGRGNADIFIKPKEIQLRVGAKQNPNSAKPTDRLLFNEKDLGYIQLCFDNYTDPNDSSNYRSAVNIVADRINILSHDSPTSFKLGDRKKLITKEEMDSILSKAHPLIYGDAFMDYLSKVITVFRTHTHPFPMMPPCLDSPSTSVLFTDLNEFLSKSVRIN